MGLRVQTSEANETIYFRDMQRGQVGVIAGSSGYNGIMVIRAHRTIVKLDDGDTWELDAPHKVKLVEPGTTFVVE